MSDTIKVEIPTWTDMSKTHKVWIKELQAYFAAIGQHRILDKSKAPTMPDAEFPEVTTQEAFIARVTKHPRASDHDGSKADLHLHVALTKDTAYGI